MSYQMKVVMNPGLVLKGTLKSSASSTQYENRSVNADGGDEAADTGNMSTSSREFIMERVKLFRNIVIRAATASRQRV